MWWRVFQLSVAFAVVASNIEFRWIDNNYAAGLLALLAAMFATALVSWLIDRLEILKRALHLKD